jgi:hypothetical protein
MWTVSAIANFTEYMKKYPDVKQFMVTGTVVNWCVLTTATDIRYLGGTGLLGPGYKLVFVDDAVSGNTFLHSPPTPNPVRDYAIWWHWFADGGGAFGPSTTIITETDMITWEQ